MSAELAPLFTAYIGLVGAAVGSFLNVVIARLPVGESLVRPRSRCPACHAGILWYDNIPLVSWLLLRGRCRSCRAPIALRYPLVELTNALLWLAVLLVVGWGWLLIPWLLLVSALLAIVFLDIDHFWVPDVLTFPAMALALVINLLPGGRGLGWALWGLLPAVLLWLFALSFKWLTKKDGMGFGDVKLLAVIGLLLGPLGALSALFLGATQGSLVGILVMLAGGHPRRAADPNQPAKPDSAAADGWVPPPRAIPFGPFLILGCFEVALLPEWFADLPARVAGLFGLT